MPPASGRMAPSSAYVRAPKNERSPPATQTPSASIVFEPALARTRPGTRKIPDPMTMPMAVNARSVVPSIRASCDVVAGAAGAELVAAMDDWIGTGGNMVSKVVYRNGTWVGVPLWYRAADRHTDC